MTSTEILMMSETVLFCKRWWIQTSVSTDLLEHNWKALTMLNARLRSPPNTGQWKKRKQQQIIAVLELNKSVSNKRVQQLYSRDQTQEVIDQAERQVASARQTLDNIWRVEEAGLSRNSPNYPRTPWVNDRHKNPRNDMRVSYRESHEQITVSSV